MKYNNLCGCTNLPESTSSNVVSLNNHGNCVKLFKEENCMGSEISLRGGVSLESMNLGTVGFSKSVKSINSCEVLESCTQLNVVIYKFEVISFPEIKSLQDSSSTTSQQLSLGPKTTFINNSTRTTVTKEYSAKDMVEESVVIARVSEFISKQVNLSIEENFGFESSISSIPQLSNKPNARMIFHSAYSAIQADSSEIFEFKEEREISTIENIQIEQCTKYTLSSIVTMIHNHPMNYKVHSKITGEFGGLKMTAEKVRELLVNVKMEYVKDFDEFTVIATSNGRLTATFAQETVVSGEGTEIESCFERGKGNSSNYYDDTSAIYYSKASAAFLLALTMVTAVAVAVIASQIIAVVKLVKQALVYQEQQVTSFDFQNLPPPQAKLSGGNFR